MLEILQQGSRDTCERMESDSMAKNIILNDLKTYLSIPIDEAGFNSELVAKIASNWMALYQMGAVVSTQITDTTTWDNLLVSEETLPMVLEILSLRVKQVFDPSPNGTVGSSLKSYLDESERRLLSTLEGVV